MLWFPNVTAYILPGWVFNVATLIHGEEAILAAVFLFTVHFFNNHFRPDKYPPPDIVMFTGAVPLEEFKREHTLEYARLVESGQLAKHLVDAPSRPMTLGSRILGITLIYLRPDTAGPGADRVRGQYGRRVSDRVVQLGRMGFIAIGAEGISFSFWTPEGEVKARMGPKTLKFKVGFYVAIALAVTLFLFAVLVVRHQRDELLNEAASHVTQISEVITKSTRYAMLQNQPDYVLRIIQDVGHQENIAKVRIMSKEGRIIHSTYPPEIGQTVDRKAEACILCHQSEQPLEQVPQSERSRIYVTRRDGGCSAAWK